MTKPPKHKTMFRFTKETLKDLKDMHGITIDKEHYVIGNKKLPKDCIELTMSIGLRPLPKETE